MTSFQAAARAYGKSDRPVSALVLAAEVGMARPLSLRGLLARLVERRPAGGVKQPDPRLPAITVTNQDGVLLVEGSGFLAGKPVTVRVTDNQLRQMPFQYSANSRGELNASLTGLVCVTGGALHISATDNRPSKTDLTGVVWSNTVHTTCP